MDTIQNIELGLITSDIINLTTGSNINDGVIKMNNNGKLFIQNGDTGPYAFCIDSNNNVGVGTTQPQQKLDISGTIVSNSYKIKDLSTIIDSSGNINANGTVTLQGDLQVNNFKTFGISGNTLINGNLDVSKNLNINNSNFNVDYLTGNIQTKGNIDLSGNFSINTNKFTISSDGNTIITNTLDVSNNSILRKNVTVLGNLNVKKDNKNSLFVDVSNNKVGINNVNIDPSYNLHIKGATRIEGNLNVNGITTINNDTVQQTTEQMRITNSGTGPAIIINQNGTQPIVEFKDDNNTIFYIANNGLVGVGLLNTNPRCELDISGSTNISKTLDISNNLNISGTSIIEGNALINGNADISNNVTINSDKFKMDTSGNIDMSGNFNIHGNLQSFGNVSQYGNFNLTGDLIIDGNLKVKKNIDLSENLRVNIDKFTVDSLGNIKSKEGFDISKNFNINNNVIVDSLSGNIICKGNVDVSNNLILNTFTIDSSGNIKSSGSLTNNNNLIINSDKFIIDAVTGNIISKGSIDISKNFTLNTNKFIVDLSGNVKSNGSLDISNNFKINTNKMTIDSFGNITGAGTLSVGNNLYINENKFTVDISGNVKLAGTLDVSNNFTINYDKFTIDTSSNIRTAGNLDISSNIRVNTNKFTIDTSGNVGSAGTVDISYNLTSNQNVLYVDSTNKSVGINKINPACELDISGQIATNTAYLGTLSNSNDIIFAHRNNINTTDYSLQQTNLGKTKINNKLSTDNIEFAFSNTLTNKMDSNGNMFINGDVYAYSDINIKKNIKTLDSALNKVKLLRGVTYNLKENKNNKRYVGVIAQEIENVLPEVVEKDGEIKTVAYNNVVGLLIEAIKELNIKADKKLILCV